MTTSEVRARAVDFVETRTVDLRPPPHLHLGYVKETGEVWVSNTGGDTITVLDHVDGRPLGEIPIGAGPAHFSFDAGCTVGFVALRDADEVVAIDPRRHKVLGRVALPPGSGPVATMPAFDRHRMYVLNTVSRTVSAIDTRTASVVATIEVGGTPLWGQPWGASYKPITKPVGKSYVPGVETDDVTVFDDRTDRVLHRVKVGHRPVRNAIFREHGHIYTANAGDDTVSVVRIADDRVVATIGVRPGPFRLLPVAALGNRNEMWVLSSGEPGRSSGCGGVTAIDGETLEVSRTVDVVDRPANWVVNPSRLLFIVSSTERQMCVYDLPADAMAGSGQLSHDPARSAISGLICTAAGTLFVLNADATVSVFKDRNAD
jgi:YVTN family beta-propeller protein